MFDRIELGIEFLEGLRALDAAIVERAAAEKCRDCAGPLHRGDYPRKPRGGLVAPDADGFTRRFSLCCGRDGCRHRATPPSVRFLGRRVYVGAVVIVASVAALAATAAASAQRVTGVPARTLRRWLRWWRGPFTTSAPFVELSARLVPLVVAKRTADFDPATIGRRAGRAHPAIAGLAGTHHDGEFARWVTFSAGSRMTDRAPPRSRRRWRYPCFLALA